VMLLPIYMDAMIKIMSIIFFGGIFMVTLLLNSEQSQKSKFKTYHLFILICCFFYILHLTDFSAQSHHSPKQHLQKEPHKHHIEECDHE